MADKTSLIEEKSPIIILLTLFSWLGLVLISWSYYYVTVPINYGFWLWMLFQSFHFWWAILWLWGIHNFWYLTLSSLSHDNSLSGIHNINSEPSVAILYTTYDDFDPIACKSCLEQTYSKTHLYICDDSKDPHIISDIDLFVRNFNDEKLTVIRRNNNDGFKAGNLNYALQNFVNEPFFLICDADEFIPHSFVAEGLKYFNDPNVAFVQASHVTRHDPKTKFADILGLSTNIFYNYWFPLRNKFGFVSCFGHGVLIKKEVWQAIEAFPEVVTEDLTFASKALRYGMRGYFAKNLIAEEAFPENYKAFLAKTLKIISGTIEFFRTEYPKVLMSPRVSITEKMDILFTYSSCFFGVIAMFNFLSGMVLSYIYMNQGWDYLNPWVFIVYLISPFTPVVPLIINTIRDPSKYIRFLFIATLSFGSSIPLMAHSSIQCILKLTKPVFNITGMVAKERQNIWEYKYLGLFGLFFLIFSLLVKQPGYEASVCFSLIFICGPMLIYFDKDTIIGMISRIVSVFPWLVFIYLILN